MITTPAVAVVQQAHMLSLDFRNIFDAKNIYEQIELPLNGEIFTYAVYQLRFFPVLSYKILF
jgi:hypothetical protein